MRKLAVCAALACGLAVPLAQGGADAAARQQPSLHLSASFYPERLGGAASIGLTVTIGSAGAQAPGPARQIDLLYPANLNIAFSDLGTEFCSQAALEKSGPPACPANSVMGYGTALGNASAAAGATRTQAKVTVLRARDRGGHIVLLFDAQGLSPVKPNVVLAATIEPARRPFGGDIRAQAPEIPAGPGAGPVALTKLTIMIGPKAHLVYTERVRGKTVHYTPRGITLPSRCPRGGFPFAASVRFAAGDAASARERVRCPAARRGKH